MNTELSQKYIFLDGEGDSWFERNNNLNMAERVKNDPILKEIKCLEINPKTVVEIGCAEGWRLNVINEMYGSECFGFDPSKKAINNGSNIYPGINLKIGTADDVECDSGSADLLIVGFCLYLCDRDELFRIAAELDRVLMNEGVMIILDFYSEVPYRNEYIHKEGVYSFKMDYSRLFTWNPTYSVLSKIITNHGMDRVMKIKDERIGIVSLRKCNNDAYMTKPTY